MCTFLSALYSIGRRSLDRGVPGIWRPHAANVRGRRGDVRVPWELPPLLPVSQRRPDRGRVLLPRHLLALGRGLHL